MEARSRTNTEQLMCDRRRRKEEEEAFLVLRLIVREGDVTRLLHYALRRVNSVLDTRVFHNALSSSGGIFYDTTMRE